MSTRRPALIARMKRQRSTQHWAQQAERPYLSVKSPRRHTRALRMPRSFMTRSSLLLLLLIALAAIDARAQTPTLEITPGSITFGCTLGGEDSTRSFVVRNTGASDVTILEYIAPAGFVAPGARDVVVPAGTELTEVLHFAPLTAGPAIAGGSLIIRTPDGDVLVPVSGEIGAEPTIGVNPTRLDFFDVAIGSSAELCITVSNPSCRPIDVLNASIDNPAFALSRIFAMPRELGPFEEQTVCVTFTPTVEGDQEGALTFDGSLGKRAVVRLFGRGVRSQIAVEPALVDFGSIDIGSASGEIVVDIVNRGSLSATIDPGLAISGANPGDFVLSSAPLRFTVGPGERAPLRLRFVPTAAGDRSAEIVLNNTSDVDPVISLRGRGVVFDVLVTPTSVDMGDVFVSQSRMAIDTVLVLNRGSEPVTIASTTIEGADAPAFERYGFVVARLNPGDNYVLDIEFKPYAPRVFTADLIVTLESGARITVPLRGRGLDTAGVRARHIAGDTIRAHVGERRMLRFTIDPPLDGRDTTRRVVIRLKLDPQALYPHGVVAGGATATRSYNAEGIAELIFSSETQLELDHFDVEIEGLFTGRPLNRVTVDSVDLGDPRIAVTNSPGVVGLEGCDVAGDSLLRPVAILSLAPNPASDRTSLHYLADGGARLSILELDGNAVKRMTLPPGGDAGAVFSLDLSAIAVGMYYVEITDFRTVDWRKLEVVR